MCEPDLAEQFLDERIRSSDRLALAGLTAMIADLRSVQANVVACGLLTNSARPLPELRSILNSHALIHTAEGVMFRESLAHAAERLKIHVLREKDAEVVERCSSILKITAPALQARLSVLGRSVGPPWREDQKHATLIGLLALRKR